MKKIFCPDIMFGNCLRSCWCHNIKTVDDGKIPINQVMKSRGEYALDVIPMKDDSYWVFAIPINKNWEPQTLKSDSLSFEVVSSNVFNLKICIQNSKEEVIFTKEVEILVEDEWCKKKIELTPVLTDARLVSFNGPSEVGEALFKNITLNN